MWQISNSINGNPHCCVKLPSWNNIDITLTFRVSQFFENCTDKFVPLFYLGVYLDIIETWADYNYKSDGFEDPESDLSM